MVKHSLAIRNALIVDGTGVAAYRGDLAIDGDRISVVGTVPGQAETEIDAGGKILAPGFIDIHTHYDPQLCWDKLASPTPEHGVTSIVMGNCSISLAPVQPQDTRRVIHLFGSVEDMPGDLLEATVPFAWSTFPEYLEHLKQGLGPNVGVFVGHSMLRLFVMGAASQERAATDDEIRQMREVLREAIRAGAFGLSFTFAHLDEHGQELPSFFSDRRERLELLAVLKEEGRGMAEVAPLQYTTQDALASIDTWGDIALTSGVTCTLSPLLYTGGFPDRWRKMLDKIEDWRARGAPIFMQTQVRPLDFGLNLSMGSAILSKMPTLRRILDLPVEERIRELRKPDIRARIDEESTDFNHFLVPATIKRSDAGENRKYFGRQMGDIAREQGKTPISVVIDIALADNLTTDFEILNYVHADIDAVSTMLAHPGIHVGSADAGAHITQFSGAGDTCYLFEKYVRQEKAMSLERAVQRLTSDLARDWGIADRGEIAVGRFADLVIFDPETIERGEEEWVDDIPGGHGRYTRHPKGIDKVLVNGEILVDRGRYTENRAGRII